ncbi:MAG: hypothetical protein KIT22_14255, partial [Verrucomicrobiae bacterium]|nr:hypothetical protein [Verrucomicrobiae bacterium]
MFCPPGSLRSGWCAAALALAVAGSGMAGAQTNGVLELDGHGSYVELSERLGEELTEATIEFWARWDHLGYYSSPLHFGDRTNAVAFNNESVGPIPKAWVQPNENASIAVTGGPLLVPGRWTHFAATLSRDGLQLWVNGVSVATNATPVADAFRRLAPARWLGRSPWEDNGYFRGALDEVRLWSRALPASEIQARLRHPARGDEPGLLAAWQFDGAPASESDRVIWSTGPDRLPAHLRGGARLAPQPWPGSGEVHRLVQISGTVRTSDGVPGPVRMRLWRDGQVDHEFFAQPDGRFLTSFMAEAGKLELEATHGRHGLWQRVDFEAGSNPSLALVLPEAPVITGRVVALDDSPQMHVPVEAWRLAEDGSHRGERLQQVAATDRVGRFELVNLPTGTYAIRCPNRANGASPDEEQICRVHPGSPPISANFRVARVFGGIGWQRFGRAEGLPDNQVHAVAVGPDGSLWVGTTAGLARRSASGFTTWTQADGLPDNLVSALAFDPSGVLWVGTPRGLARRIHERFEPAPGAACPTNLINRLAAAGDGAVWAATETGLARFREGEWRWFGPADGLPCRMVRQLESMADGSVRAVTPAGYVRCTGDRLTLLQDGDSLPGVPMFPLPWTPSLPSWVNDLPQEWRPTSGGGGWIRHLGGLAHFDGGRWTWCWPIGSLREGGVTAIAPDAGQSLWVGTHSGGLWHCDLGGQFSLTEADGLPDRQVTSTARGPDGALWIGTEKGMARWQDDRMQVWSTAEGLPADGVTALLTDRTGRLWAGTRQGLAWFNGTRFVPAPDSPASVVSCLAEDASGKLWISTLEHGIHRRNGLAMDPLVVDGPSEAGYSAVLPARDGAMWMASWSLTRLYRGSRTNYAFAPYASVAGLGGLPIASLAESPDGTLWVGTKGHGLFRWRAGRWDQFTPVDGLA